LLRPLWHPPRVARGSYRRVEIVFLLMTLAFLAYPISAVMAHPNWGQVARQTVVPSFQLIAAYIFTFVATLGTTITPYMQVYVQSSVAEKNLTMATYKYQRVDVARSWICTRPRSRSKTRGVPVWPSIACWRASWPWAWWWALRRWA
jgi:hypothetical protein